MPRRLTLRHHETELHNPVISRCGLRCATDTPLTLISITHAHIWGEQDQSPPAHVQGSMLWASSNPHIYYAHSWNLWRSSFLVGRQPPPPPQPSRSSVRCDEFTPSIPEIINVSLVLPKCVPVLNHPQRPLALPGLPPPLAS